MKPRDQVFTHNGKRLLIDTAVLPTIRCSVDNGRHWTEGDESLHYLAGKLEVPMVRDSLLALEAAWHEFKKQQN